MNSASVFDMPASRRINSQQHRYMVLGRDLAVVLAGVKTSKQNYIPFKHSCQSTIENQKQDVLSGLGIVIFVAAIMMLML